LRAVGASSVAVSDASSLSQTFHRGSGDLPAAFGNSEGLSDTSHSKIGEVEEVCDVW